MSESNTLGKHGEGLACDYLKKKGHCILERNVRFVFGEIDIVAIAKDKTLVFVEVKTLIKGELQPEDQMTDAKIKKFRRAAEIYANNQTKLIQPAKGFRLDLISVVKDGDVFSVKHYENIC